MYFFMFLVFYFSFQKLFIGVQLIYNVVLVSAVQQSECIHISTLFQTPFPYRYLQSTKWSSLCYTVGSYQLSFIYSSVYMSIPASQFMPPKLYMYFKIYDSLTLHLFCDNYALNNNRMAQKSRNKQLKQLPCPIAARLEMLEFNPVPSYRLAPEVSDGQGSLVCCSPWGHKELDMTERLN